MVGMLCRWDCRHSEHSCLNPWERGGTPTMPTWRVVETTRYTETFLTQICQMFGQGSNKTKTHHTRLPPQWYIIICHFDIADDNFQSSVWLILILFLQPFISLSVIKRMFYSFFCVCVEDLHSLIIYFHFYLPLPDNLLFQQGTKAPTKISYFQSTFQIIYGWNKHFWLPAPHKTTGVILR